MRKLVRMKNAVRASEPVKKFSGAQRGKLKKLFTSRTGFHKDQIRRARLRPIVCLDCACQGCPFLTKALRTGGSVCGSTVDKHSPDRDLALKDCAPGILAGKGFRFWPQQAGSPVEVPMNRV